jgi:hypothetical protein
MRTTAVLFLKTSVFLCVGVASSVPLCVYLPTPTKHHETPLPPHPPRHPPQPRPRPNSTSRHQQHHHPPTILHPRLTDPRHHRPLNLPICRHLSTGEILT